MREFFFLQGEERRGERGQRRKEKHGPNSPSPSIPLQSQQKQAGEAAGEAVGEAVFDAGEASEAGEA